MIKKFTLFHNLLASVAMFLIMLGFASVMDPNTLQSIQSFLLQILLTPFFIFLFSLAILAYIVGDVLDKIGLLAGGAIVIMAFGFLWLCVTVISANEVLM